MSNSLATHPMIEASGLEIDRVLYDFIAAEAIPGTGIDTSAFWSGFASLVRRLSPRNAELLAERNRLQALIDSWHRQHAGAGFDRAEYRRFLVDIGYLVTEGQPFEIATENVDAEIALVPGPQLVVPVNNSRYALNAANARWGSLYDALYGTDAIPWATDEVREGYDPRRGARVIRYARDFLDRHFALQGASHRDVRSYRISGQRLEAELTGGGAASLGDPTLLAGYSGAPANPDALLFRHHGLHVELRIDRTHHIGRDDPAGVSDVMLESAVTAIQDCEDSVAAVTAHDKVAAYRTWLGLMSGNLECSFEKGGKTMSRRLNPDRRYRSPSGSEVWSRAGASCWSAMSDITCSRTR